jgi:hypothetical protein
LKITIHRGTQEIGGSCIELSVGETRVILDLGMPLFQPRNKKEKLNQAATTQRYAHLANDPLKHAADSIGLELSRKLEGKTSEKKQPARRLRVMK